MYVSKPFCLLPYQKIGVQSTSFPYFARSAIYFIEYFYLVPPLLGVREISHIPEDV